MPCRGVSIYSVLRAGQCLRVYVHPYRACMHAMPVSAVPARSSSHGPWAMGHGPGTPRPPLICVVMAWTPCPNPNVQPKPSVMGWAHAAAAAAFAGHLHLTSAWMDVALARERIIAAAWHSLSASCPPDGTPHATAVMELRWTRGRLAAMPMKLLDVLIDAMCNHFGCMCETHEMETGEGATIAIGKAKI